MLMKYPSNPSLKGNNYAREKARIVCLASQPHLFLTIYVKTSQKGIAVMKHTRFSSFYEVNTKAYGSNEKKNKF